LHRPYASDRAPNPGAVCSPSVALDVVRYENQAPAPINADGLGSSLGPLPAAAYGNDPINWQASSGTGSPGVENPGGPAPFRIESVDWWGGTSSVLHIHFTAVASLTYTVQYRNSLIIDGWSKLTDVPASVATQSVEVRDATGNSMTRYYRIVTPQQP